MWLRPQIPNTLTYTIALSLVTSHYSYRKHYLDLPGFGQGTARLYLIDNFQVVLTYGSGIQPTLLADKAVNRPNTSDSRLAEPHHDPSFRMQKFKISTCLDIRQEKELCKMKSPIGGIEPPAAV